MTTLAINSIIKIVELLFGFVFNIFRVDAEKQKRVMEILNKYKRSESTTEHYHDVDEQKKSIELGQTKKYEEKK